MLLKEFIPDATVACLSLSVIKKNMKTISFFIFFLILAGTSCKKSGIVSDIPPCIYKEIADNKNNDDWSTGSVEEYLFQNKIVYAFNPDNTIIADGATIIKDSNCNVLCSVGGFGGPSVNMCNGENFFQVATIKRTIWIKK